MNHYQSALLIAVAVAGLSGWGAIFAWWLRERSKTVRAIRELRRTNSRLQKTLMFTIDKWRDQVFNNRKFLHLEQAYAEALAKEWGVTDQDAKNDIRANTKPRSGFQGGDQVDLTEESETRRSLAAIKEVERYATEGDDRIAEFGIEDGLRKAA